MKIGIIADKGFPNLELVQSYIHKIEILYRPFGNFDDEYEEKITVLTELKNYADCVAAIKAAKCNFKVRKVKNIDEVIKKAHCLVVFRVRGSKPSMTIIDKVLKAEKHIEVMYTNKIK